jgi:hypothetical protein
MWEPARPVEGKTLPLPLRTTRRHIPKDKTLQIKHDSTREHAPCIGKINNRLQLFYDRAQWRALVSEIMNDGRLPLTRSESLSLAQCRLLEHTLVDTVTKLRAQQTAGNLLTSWVTANSSTALHHGATHSVATLSLYCYLC